MTAQRKSKKPVHKKSQSKTKKSAKPLAPIEAAKPVNKVHPFALFMKGKDMYRPSSPPMQKLSNHDTYRKKAI
jgi:hypothetical protein